MRSVVWCAALLTLFTSACNSSSSSPSGGAALAGSTAAGSSSGSITGAPAGGVNSALTGTGLLAKKAADFEAIMAAQHIPHGIAQDITLDPATGQVKSRSGASRCLWTGVYAASQAMRFRATGDAGALQTMEKCLWALHNMHAITGTPGVVSRGFDYPQFQHNGIPGTGAFSAFHYDAGKPSRDQYAGWFYGIGMCWDEIQDPALKAALEADVRAVADLLMGNDLVMEAPWNGKTQKFFNLNPDGINLDDITPQTWAKVDDFPLNLIVKAVPYDKDIADALKSVKLPPIRAGEAVRALLMFTVTEHVTKDPKYTAYKRDMLYGSRQFSRIIVDYGTFIDDLLLGRNKPVVRQSIEALFGEIGRIVGVYLKAKNKNAILVALAPVIANGIGKWFAGLATRMVDYIHDPKNQNKLQGFVQDAAIATLVLRIAGQGKLADSIDKFINDYGRNLNHQGLVDAAGSIRSYLTTNLFYFPMVALVSLEQDPATIDVYRTTIERNWDRINDEHNPVVNLVHAGYGFAAGPNDVPDSLSALTLFPTDLTGKKFDHSNDPGLVVSRWPDRFGRVGNLATTPHFFPINERGIDIFPWRSHPRAIVSGGNNPNARIAPLGYLSAYWIGRERGLISSTD